MKKVFGLRSSVFGQILLFVAACGNQPSKLDQEPGAVEKAKAEDAEKAQKSQSQSQSTSKGSEAVDDLKELTELSVKGPTQDKFPQADAYIALDRRDIELTSDNTVIERHKTIVRILDAQRGKEKFADLHIRFDSARQDLKIVTARTVNSDGVPHVASNDEIGDIVPPELADATSYSDVRERVVSFPSVDMGSVLELEYVKTTKATPDSPLGGQILLGEWDPVKSMVVTITVPGGAAAPKLATTGTAPAPTVEGNTTTYTLADLPDRHQESSQPADATVLPRLVYGFSKDWASVTEPTADRFLRVAVPAKMPEAVKAQADALIAGATSDEDKAKKLFGFVAHDVRTIELPLGSAGYEPHAPEVVLANRYADARDKVALLLALAASEGIAGKPVLVPTRHVQVIPSVPTLAQFEHVVAKLSIGGKDVWLDPEDDSAQFGFAMVGQDNLVLPLERKGGELGQRPALDPKTSVSHTTATLAINDKGDLDVTYAYSMSGLYAVEATKSMRPLQGEHVDKFFQRGAAQVAANAVDKEHKVGDTMSIEGNFEVSQHVVAPGYAALQGSYRVLELPPSTLGLANEHPDASLSARKYPLFVGTGRTESEDVKLEVPAGWKVTYVPPLLEGASEGLKYTDKCDVSGQTVTCHTELTMDKIEISTEKYGAYHDAFAKLHAYERRIVVLQKASS